MTPSIEQGGKSPREAASAEFDKKLAVARAVGRIRELKEFPSSTDRDKQIGELEKFASEQGYIPEQNRQRVRDLTAEAKRLENTAHEIRGLTETEETNLAEIYEEINALSKPV